MAVFYLFLLALVGGCLTTVYWVPGQELGRGYFQIIALIVLGLLGLVVSMTLLHPLTPFGAASGLGHLFLAFAGVGSLLYWMSVWKERWGASWIASSLALLGALGALMLAGEHLIRDLTPLPHRSLLVGLTLASSALLLGWSLVTMLLGHWYLVSPKLPFRHLIVFCRILLAVVILRITSITLALWAAHSVDPLLEPHPWRLLVTFGGQGMFFWFRLLWGLVIPALLALMALHCARNRSNQSATGILYVLVVGSLIGELTGLYLTVVTGVPV